jgi:hypothetical protein
MRGVAQSGGLNIENFWDFVKGGGEFFEKYAFFVLFFNFFAFFAKRLQVIRL